MPGPEAAPPGTGYAGQGRGGGRSPAPVREFLLVVGLVIGTLLVVTVVGGVLAAVLGAEPTDPESDSLFADPLADQALGLITLAALVPAVMLGVRWMGRRPAGTLSSVLGRVRWGWLGRCAAVAFPVMAVQFTVLALWADGTDAFDGLSEVFPGWPRFLLSVAVLWVLVPFQAAAEEYVFRGWLVQWAGQFVRSPWPAVVVASALFALAHGWGEASGFGLLFYSAVWWGWLVLRTGGLEAVIALHAANNMLAFLLAAMADELADQSTAADAPWQALVVEVVFSPLYCLLIARLADRRKVDRLTPAPAASPT
ncbi:CPBP family intramembrane glutamic endopeptidase [Streptomyces sp. NPDC001941]|uniref:CPBP family intramembrane glutamic endopeptidase n=1 Tax=Streptomyces sp. NPDC001941 TaxID=3154659 RepID=UPI00332440D8